MSNNYTVKYRSFETLLADVASDFKKYQLQDLIDPAELIKVAKRVTYDLGLRVYQTKERVLEVEKGRVRLPNDFYVHNFALHVYENTTPELVIPETHSQEKAPCTPGCAITVTKNLTSSIRTIEPIPCDPCKPNKCIPNTVTVICPNYAKGNFHRYYSGGPPCHTPENIESITIDGVEVFDVGTPIDLYPGDEGSGTCGYELSLVADAINSYTSVPNYIAEYVPKDGDDEGDHFFDTIIITAEDPGATPNGLEILVLPDSGGMFGGWEYEHLVGGAPNTVTTTEIPCDCNECPEDFIIAGDKAQGEIYAELPGPATFDDLTIHINGVNITGGIVPANELNDDYDDQMNKIVALINAHTSVPNYTAQRTVTEDSNHFGVIVTAEDSGTHNFPIVIVPDQFAMSSIEATDIGEVTAGTADIVVPIGCNPCNTTPEEIANCEPCNGDPFTISPDPCAACVQCGCDTGCEPCVTCTTAPTSCTLNCAGETVEIVQVMHSNTHKYKHMQPLRIEQNVENVGNALCPDLDWAGPGSARIKDGWLNTSFETGKVYINYQGHLEDEDGGLLVMDHDLINEYYEYALKKRILENLIMNDMEPNAQKAQFIERNYREARKAALSVVNTPNFGELKELYEANRNAFYNKYYDMFSSNPRFNLRNAYGQNYKH